MQALAGPEQPLEELLARCSPRERTLLTAVAHSDVGAAIASLGEHPDLVNCRDVSGRWAFMTLHGRWMLFDRITRPLTSCHHTIRLGAVTTFQ